jgi:hypothetical protein
MAFLLPNRRCNVLAPRMVHGNRLRDGNFMEELAASRRLAPIHGESRRAGRGGSRPDARQFQTCL